LWTSEGERDLPATGPPVLLDLADVPGLELVDNLEGMTRGPRLPDGRRTLVLVSDKNFSTAQVTQLLAFAVATGRDG
jgi:hypothetical protein